MQEQIAVTVCLYGIIALEFMGKACFIIHFIVIFYACSNTSQISDKLPETYKEDSLSIADIHTPAVRKITPHDIHIVKSLGYDKHTLSDSYPYKDTVRIFQWDKIRAGLALIENSQREKAMWGVLQNRGNRNGESPLVYTFNRNDYKRVVDTLGVERYQAAPLYMPGDSVSPVRYGRDGWLVKLLTSDTLNRVRVEGVSFQGTYDVPRRYITNWGDTIRFDKVIFVDVANQNAVTLEKQDSVWHVRSMNPATTGKHRPPYAQETPTGLFAVLEKKPKMLYTHDGSSELAGYAPYASRFSTGAYLHGVPTNRVSAPVIEYSTTLGTTPRSHKCVRLVSSHAKYIYDWAKVGQSLVFVID